MDNYKKYNTCVMGIPEGEEREKEAKEIMAGSFPFPKSMTDIKP